jgi:hypothetical protein
MSEANSVRGILNYNMSIKTCAKVCRCTGKKDKIGRCNIHSFPIRGFLIGDDRAPQFDSAETVLVHPEPLLLNMNYMNYRGGLKETGILAISENVSIDRKFEWEDDDIEPELNELREMSAEQAREWLRKNTIHKPETDEDVKALISEYIERTTRNFKYEVVRATSLTGEYTMDELAKIIYYGARSFKGCDESEMVYLIQVDVKSSDLHYCRCGS